MTRLIPFAAPFVAVLLVAGCDRSPPPASETKSMSGAQLSVETQRCARGGPEAAKDQRGLPSARDRQNTLEEPAPTKTWEPTMAGEEETGPPALNVHWRRRGGETRAEETPVRAGSPRNMGQSDAAWRRGAIARADRMKNRVFTWVEVPGFGNPVQEGGEWDVMQTGRLRSVRVGFAGGTTHGADVPDGKGKGWRLDERSVARAAG